MFKSLKSIGFGTFFLFWANIPITLSLVFIIKDLILLRIGRLLKLSEIKEFVNFRYAA
ncbi:MAG: hypothetical protein KAX10_01330 [Candidatus Lokiarchaeota archaeon]|nr:hypothetical protein [Candidatus Lokiarchaeota archaeon]